MGNHYRVECNQRRKNKVKLTVNGHGALDGGACCSRSGDQHVETLIRVHENCVIMNYS